MEASSDLGNHGYRGMTVNEMFPLHKAKHCRALRVFPVAASRLPRCSNWSLVLSFPGGHEEGLHGSGVAHHQ